MIKTSATLPLQYDTGFSPYYAHEFDAGLEWVRENGFDGVELVISEPDKVDIKPLNKKLTRLGLEVSTIATGQSTALEGISFTDDLEEIRKRSAERIKMHIDLSTDLVGRPNVTIGLIRGKGNPLKVKEHLQRLEHELEACIDYAQGRNVILNLEPINRYETAMLNSCEETLKFLERLGNPESVGILYDTFHSNIEDKDMLHTIESLKGRILHVHFADSNRRLPGEGHLDFKTIYGKLLEVGYEGYVSVETLNLPDRETIKKNAGRSIQEICGKGA